MSEDIDALGSLPDVAIDAADHLAEDLICARCHYNLRTLKIESSCPECGLAIESSILQRARYELGRWTVYRFGWPSRLVSILYGIVLPVLAFVLFEVITPVPPAAWESLEGYWQAYCYVLLGGPPARPFYPFVLWAMGSLGMLLIYPEKMARYRLVRTGVICGIVVGTQYLLILCVGGGSDVIIAALVITGGVVGLVAAFILGPDWLARRKKIRISEKFGRTAWIGLGVAMVFLICIHVVAPITLVAWVFAIVGSIVGAPLWFLLVFVAMAVRIARSQIEPLDGTRTLPFWFGGWLGGYVLAWGGAIVLAIETYQKLPTSPPTHCYIATAAARGHRFWVRSEMAISPVGTPMLVNRQLRTLKCAELAAQALLPQAHRCCRWFYDMVGPVLARGLVHPLVADLAYTALLPIQWLALIILRPLVRDIDHHIDQLYGQLSELPPSVAKISAWPSQLSD